LADYLRALAHLKAQRSNKTRPFVTLAFAQSLDGSIAHVRDALLPISGAGSREMTHNLRALHEGILVGVGTVLADDPSLTARLEGQHPSQPRPLILDTQRRTPPSAKLHQHPREPWFFCATDRWEESSDSGIRFFPAAVEPDGQLNLGDCLQQMREQGLESVMVEGGGKVIRSFIQKQLVDFLVLTIAPTFVGGYAAVPAPLDPTPDFPKLNRLGSTWLGEDLVIWGTLT
jgi:riboflavin-specific deaminase-like protein